MRQAKTSIFTLEERRVRSIERDFDAVYKALALLGKCDEPGSAEYHRVKAEWKAVCCPAKIIAFVAWSANRDVTRRIIWPPVARRKRRAP
jgi:hypothetical protein